VTGAKTEFVYVVQALTFECLDLQTYFQYMQVHLQSI